MEARGLSSRSIRNDTGQMVHARPTENCPYAYAFRAKKEGERQEQKQHILLHKFSAYEVKNN